MLNFWKAWGSRPQLIQPTPQQCKKSSLRHHFRRNSWKQSFNIKGTAHQKVFFRINLIFWTVMGDGGWYSSFWSRPQSPTIFWSGKSGRSGFKMVRQACSRRGRGGSLIKAASGFIADSARLASDTTQITFLKKIFFVIVFAVWYLFQQKTWVIGYDITVNLSIWALDTQNYFITLTKHRSDTR